MKTVIRSYVSNGHKIEVVEYVEGKKIEYHVEHDINEIMKDEWYDEFGKVRAIQYAQFLTGWVVRNGLIKA